MNPDAAIESDIRTKRRLRTTQSCLNCHTSKRKCDRKRPCSRCVSLGLTGLCVYENDDLTARDDPNVDELTRYRNRIAELEAVVREIRGRPHPRWADKGGRRVSHFTHNPQADPFEGLTALSDSSTDSSEGMYHEIIKAEHDGIDPSFTVGSHASSSRSSSVQPSTPIAPSSYADGPLLVSPSHSPSYFHHSGNAVDAPKCSARCSSIRHVATTLESLSFELQKASATLGTQHSSTDTCQVLRRISELRDTLAALTPNPSSSYHTYSPAASSESSLAHALSYSQRAPQETDYAFSHSATPIAVVPGDEWYSAYPYVHPHPQLPTSSPSQHPLYPTYAHGSYTHMSP